MFGLFKKQPVVEPPLPVVPTVWPPTSLVEHGPRPARFTSNTRMTIIGSRIASALVIAFGILIVLNMADRTDKFATEGKAITAKIVDQSVQSGKSRTYRITYEYEFDGRVFSDTERISEYDYESMRIGDPVTVTVLPNDPLSHRYGRVTPEDARDEQMLGSVVVMGISLVLGVFAIGYRSHAQGHLEILRDWDARPAQAIRLSSESAGKSGTTYTIGYRLLRPNGKIDEFTHSETGHSGPRANPGDFFTVLVNPRSPHTVMAEWDLKTVEVAPEGTPVREL